MTDHETPQRRIVCAAMRNAWNSVICSPRHWDMTARRLAAGQIIRRVGGDEGRLFSENLY